jgi:ADP-heptose:LPS heptosyltransferase
MFSRLQIYEPRERALVGLADLATAPLAWFGRRRGAPAGAAVRRLLLLRLERIGDLVMVLDAIHDAREAWPDAEIDLAVASWNEPLARLIPGITRLEIVDVPWLARDSRGQSWRALRARARTWRGRYDLVVNFEPDIRSNWLAWLTRAPRRAGFWTGGGGAFLTDALAYAPATHVADNARRLVRHVSGRAETQAATPGPSRTRLAPPADAVARAQAVLGTSRRPLIGLHASGGREVKQWHLDRFAEVGRTLADARQATLVLTGAGSDRAIVDAVRHALGDRRVIDVTGTLDLPTLAALLSQLDLLITGDTGPMHLAALMGTPLVALFGPSDPRRYGPLGERQRVLRIDLPCSPCGRVRLPPAWCRGHVPACLDGIQVDAVVAAANDLLDRWGQAEVGPSSDPGLTLV